MGLESILLGIFSGTIFGGKSTTLEYVQSQPPYRHANVIKMDEVRLGVFKSNRALTKTEHVFKNEATRFELKKEIISQRPDTIFTEMVLLTRKDHQKPLVDMANDTAHYLQRICEEEKMMADGAIKPSSLCLRIILFFCDIDAVRRRIGYRNDRIVSEGRDGLFRITWEQWVDHMQEFEIPVDYEPLFVDTSDESVTGIEKSRNEVLAFLSGAHIDEHTNDLRRQKLQALIDSMKRK